MKKGMAVLVALIMTFIAGNAYSVEYEQMKTLRGHTEDVQSVSFSRDGKLMASGSNDKTVIVWNTDTWKQVSTFEGHERDVQAVAFSPDGKLLASGERDKRVFIRDAVSGKRLNTVKTYNSVNSIAFSPDGRYFANASSDKTGTIKIWKLKGIDK